VTLAATFLGGAKSRLLPASIPFRFFATATIFHVGLWMALWTGADQATSFRGGLGPALAAIHLLTLGILTTTAVGASVQLLPVATRRSLAAVWPIKLVFWLTVPGIAASVAGMYVMHAALVVLAGGLTTVGLIVFAALLADNLRRAGSLPIVAAYGWAALAALVLVVTLGLALAFDYQIGMLPDHGAVALAHMILGGFGFMGLLALGFSHVLVPMYALSAAPAKRPATVGLVLAVAGVAVGAAGALAGSVILLTVAGLVGLGAVAVHLRLMHRVLATGMRKRLGLSFVLIRASWALLPISILVGLAALYGWAGPNGATLFGFLLIGGWLLTFLLGILQRILPFLASMHAARSASGAPSLVSELAAGWPLTVHAVCHGIALAMLTVAIVVDSTSLARAAAGIGLIGAVSFAWFTAEVMRRLVGSANR
jgi:hypothetical protein